MNKKKSKSVYTMIGSDVEIEGSISLKQGIIIYGQVHGDVKTEGPVRIAQYGLVDGNVTGLDIRVGGTVLGNIIGNKGLQLNIMDGNQVSTSYNIA